MLNKKEKMLNKIDSNIKRIISIIIIIISIVPSLWFMISPRYYYKDNCGNYAGAVILLGAICISSLVDYYKSRIEKYAYILKFFFGVYFVWSEMMMLYYNAKVYMMAFVTYLIINKIPLKSINRFLIQCGIVALLFGSFFVNRYINSYHVGLYSIRINYGIIAYFVVVLLILAFTCYINYSETIQGRSRVLSGIITVLLCLVLDDSYVKWPLLLSLFVILLLGDVLLETDNKENCIIVGRKVHIEKNRIIRGGLSILSVLIPYCILGPLEIYAGNSTELTFPYYHFFIPLTLLSVAFATFFAILFSFVEDKLHGLICAAIVAIGVTSWAQAMFLNKNIFNVNGHSINWTELRTQTSTNLAIWIICVVLAIILYIVISEKIDNRNIQMWIAGLFSAIQLVAVVSLLLTVDPMPESQWIFDSSDEFKVAQEDNIIVLILDSFGQESLEETIKSDEDFMNSLCDFTMYTNANSTYNGTFPSITYMFTGKETPDEKGFDVLEYTNSAYSTEHYTGFTDKIKEFGYHLRYYIHDTNLFGDFSNVEGRFDNAASITANVKYKQLLKRMMQMAVYRYAPLIIKPYYEISNEEFFGGGIFYSENWNWPICANYEFFDHLKQNGLSFSDEKKEIKIIHLFGLHHPFGTDSNCNEKKDATKQENIYGLKLLVDTYLDELNRLGVYDSSTVIITSDHGGNLTESDLFPILLIKRRGEQHSSTQINNSPIDSKDFVPTVLDIIGADNYSEYGLSVFDNTGKNRNRVFYNRNGIDDYTKYEYYGDNEQLLKEIERQQ